MHVAKFEVSGILSCDAPPKVSIICILLEQMYIVGDYGKCSCS